VKQFESVGLKIVDHQLWILDQTLLPHEEKWLLMNDLSTMIEAIKSLRVRGAPLIGCVAAAYLELNGKRPGVSDSEFRSAAEKLRQARPTAVNLMAAVDRVLAGESAWRILEEDVALCEGMARHGAALIERGENIITHCNTGGLATVGLGTALAVIFRAHDQGKKIHVYVDETRPLLQGGRLTTWELAKHGVPYTLICDNMAAILMSQGKVQRALVGADRIAMNGDFANKVGTYSLAVNCHFHGVPFHPVAPVTTVDPACAQGSAIEVEQRHSAEVMGASCGSRGSLSWAPAQSRVFNPSFDVTPVDLVSSLVLSSGVILKGDLKAGRLKQYL
jgi:methylthioribose-1-phosphate isomerase